MKLSNKYNVPESTIKNMVKDGVLGSHWPRYEEIYTEYQRIRQAHSSNASAYMEVSINKNVNERFVKHVVSIMDNI